MQSVERAIQNASGTTFLCALPGWSSNQLEKQGVTLKATSAMLRGSSVSNGLFRRGSKRLSNDGLGEAMQSKHADEIKKADHLRKKLKTHHQEARSSMAKKLQVENAR